MPAERFFYHSFPRRGAKLGNADALGLQTLDSLARNGFLLVPEVVTWIDPLQPSAQPLRAYQRRVCFTELAPSEVAEHSKVFGTYAIEYRVDVLRAMGALPVIYVPEGDAAAGLESIGAAILANIAGAISLLRTASEFARTPGDVLTFNLKMRDGEQTNETFSPMETLGIRKFVALLEKAEGMNMDRVSNALGIMASLFYPTENAQFTGPLGYYRQREWRIVSGPRLGDCETSFPTNAAEQEALLAIDSEFFGRTIEFSDGPSTMARKSHFMRTASERHVLSLARRVIVPASQVAAAVGILEAHGLSVPVVCDAED